jgi:alpha-glucosidase
MVTVLSLDSPGGTASVTVTVAPESDADHRTGLFYEVAYEGRSVVEESALSLSFSDGELGAPEFVDSERASVDETWTPAWGATDEVENRYEELLVTVREATPPRRRLRLVFRAYDDGVGFRYAVPEQEALSTFELAAEDTEFRLAGPRRAWWFPVDDADHRSFEQVYRETPLGECRTTGTPATVEFESGVYAAFHEAALVDYAGMELAPLDAGEGFRSELVPLPDGTKVRAETPHRSPWRAIVLGSDPGDLVASHLIENLNEPCALEDASWIEPGTYVGVWWEMHKGASTWVPGPDLGATTENTKRYVDFASDHEIPYVLAEGWNVGWEGWDVRDTDGARYDPSRMDFTTATDAFDVEAVLDYCEERDVEFLMHAETVGDLGNFHEQLEEAFEWYAEIGAAGVKTGYVGPFTDDYTHHDQRRVNRYREVIEAAAEHRLLVDQHEPVKPTGETRTYPNLLTAEGVRGMEFEAWSEGNPPEHTVTLPFTRMVAGPLDYTPGIFDLTWDPRDDATRVHSTRARQLALYPILLSGLQMAADLPEHYEGRPEFAFLEAVPASWDETTVPSASVGEYVTIARRRGDEWYVGSATDSTPRSLAVPLEFLDEGTYVAEIYGDAADAELDRNPAAVRIDEVLVDASDELVAAMAGGGGQAVRLRPANGTDDRDLSRYERPELRHRVNAPDAVDPGEPFQVTVKVRNDGSVVDGANVGLTASRTGGGYVESRERFRRVAPEDPAWLRFELSLPEPGTYELVVEDGSVEAGGEPPVDGTEAASTTLDVEK